jgi:hypothetical protein
VKFLPRLLTARNQAPADGDDAVGEQFELAAQDDELAADLADRFAAVLSEAGDRLEFRRQAAGQPVSSRLRRASVSSWRLDCTRLRQP